VTGNWLNPTGAGLGILFLIYGTGKPEGWYGIATVESLVRYAADLIDYAGKSGVKGKHDRLKEYENHRLRFTYKPKHTNRLHLRL